MSKEVALSLLRSVLTFAGFFLVGRSVTGHVLDAGVLETVSGVVLALVGTIWGIKDKSTGAEQWASLARSILTGIGGIGVSWGLLTANTLAAVSAFVTAILPVILSQLNKTTIAQIHEGEVKPEVKTETKAGVSKSVATGKVVPIIKAA
jgi:hypothetical protein